MELKNRHFIVSLLPLIGSCGESLPDDESMFVFGATDETGLPVEPVPAERGTAADREPVSRDDSDQGDSDSRSARAPDAERALANALESLGISELGRREVVFSTPEGLSRATFTIEDGVALMDGDIILGSADDWKDGQPSFIDLGKPWPCGIVNYYIPEGGPTGFTSSESDTIREAVDEYEMLTDLRFIESPTEDTTLNIVVFEKSDGASSHVGVQGGKQSLRLISSPTKGMVMHEIGHAIGLYHEHQRADRDDWVNYHESCVKLGEADNFEIRSGGLYSLYDLDSIMHYSSSAFAKTDCPTLTVKDHVDPAECRRCDFGDPNDPNDNIIKGSGGQLSQGDLDGIEMLYAMEWPLDDQALGDFFGEELVAGDFNGDEFPDFVVSAPGRDRVGQASVGSAALFYGGPGGPYACKELHGWMFPTQENSEARFGESLAVGDLNGDGYDDLLVGAPYDGLDDHGTVVKFIGGPSGLHWNGAINQASYGGENTPNALFGSSVAIARLFDDAHEDLIVGARGVSEGRGAVYVADEYWISPNAWTVLNQTTRRPNGIPLGENKAWEYFGSAVTTGDFDGDGQVDFAVSADCDEVEGNRCAGSVFLFRGGETIQGWRRLDQRGMGMDEAWDRFGTALGAADANADGKPELLVGTPEEDDNGAGIWNVGYTFMYGATESSVYDYGGMRQPGVGFEEGDRFGSSIATVSHLGTPLLIVGAKGERIGSSPPAGIAFLYQGTQYGPEALGYVHQGDVPGAEHEAGDEFGASVAAGGNGVRSWIAVGAPREDEEGVVYLFEKVWTGGVTHTATLRYGRVDR